MGEARSDGKSGAIPVEHCGRNGELALGN